jgi:hypothetical protein
MPIIDFPNHQIPKGYQLPDPPVKLVENMEYKEVVSYVYQELFKIYQSKDNYIIKEMKKEDIYDKLIDTNYDIEELFQIDDND